MPVSASVRPKSRAAVIVAISLDTWLMGWVSIRASQKLPIAARTKPPKAIVARATSASLVAARAAASIDVSV